MKHQHHFFVSFCMLAAGLGLQNNAMAQNSEDLCCSNAYVYANVMVQQIRSTCMEVPKRMSDNDLDRLIRETINGYTNELNALNGLGLNNGARSCYGDRPLPIIIRQRIEGREIKIDPRLCYAPTVLIPIYAKHVSQALETCGANRVVVPTPTQVNVNLPQAPQCVCCAKEQCDDSAELDDNSKPGTDKPLPIPASEKIPQLPPEKEIVPPVPPQVPTEPMLSVGLTNAIRPSDTRMSTLQMPVVMNDGSSYASVGARIKPYSLVLQDDILKAISSDKHLDVQEDCDLLKALWFSFGASQGPKWNREGMDTNKAIAIGVDIINQLDPLLNSNLGKCIKDALDDAGKKFPRDLDAAQQAFIAARDKCFQNADYAMSANIATADGVYLRPSYSFEYFPLPGLSFTSYTNLYWVDRQDDEKNLYLPIEVGTQIAYGASIYSIFADGSSSAAIGDRPEFSNLEDRLRFSGGVGGSLALFNGLTVTFGVRYVPSAWEAGGPEHDVKYISSIGWAGNDVSSEYVNYLWGEKLQDLQEKEKERIKRNSQESKKQKK